MLDIKTFILLLGIVLLTNYLIKIRKHAYDPFPTHKSIWKSKEKVDSS